MKRVLVVYFSHSGVTEKSAGYIAEGVRFNGIDAVVKSISEVASPADLQGFDGYIFGSPTFSLDVPGPMRNFMRLAAKASLAGKLAGAFGSYRHEVGYEPGGKAADLLIEAMEKDLAMTPFKLGALKLKEDVIESDEGLRASQSYGKVFGQELDK